MASKQIFEEVYTQTNIILCKKPQKVYSIEEKKVFGNDNSKVTHWFSDFGTHLYQKYAV